ncbi:MAG: tetratricopeptide repeat protein [Acidobacteriia bacterium]|jgi:tetratricopeptide (TPR) repeat protein|nr:tetratricopeptide repeat protein [Terriglobia bacterium]
MQRKPSPRGLLIFVALLALVATGCNKLKARDELNKGVAQYKSAKFDRAIEHFQRAIELDPELLNARLYLATAYASQYIPGAPSEENIRMGEQAVREFEKVLEVDPNNLSALDGIGSILFNMGGNPFKPELMERSKQFHMKHIQIKPDDPEPYYWVGVINWTLAYRQNKELRAEYNRRNPNRQVKDVDPLPVSLREQFARSHGAMVDEGIRHLEKAIELNPQYDEAMAYLNLLYRQKADQVTSEQEREQYIAKAEALVDKVKEVRQMKEAAAPTS